MNTSTTLHHNLISIPTDKEITNPVAERHDLVLLFDCAKSNPNGDPDTGNMPRVQPDSLKGLVTDVCLKRKVRNVFALYNPDGSSAQSDTNSWIGYRLFIREGAIIERLLTDTKLEEEAKKIFLHYPVDGLTFDEKTWKEASVGSKKKKPEGEDQSETEDATLEDSAKGKKSTKPKGNRYPEFRDRAFRDAICSTYFDVRYFGQVASTSGPLKGSFYGQIRGPLQFTFAESLDKILPIDATITRCAVASEEEAKKKDDDNRTMGRKHGIDYGLYRCHIHFSPAFATKTGFSYYDLDNFLFALVHMFDDDHAAGRHLRLVGLVDFQHKSSLGNAPAHKLCERVKVNGVKEERAGKQVFRSSGSEFPRSLEDYSGKVDESELNVKNGDLTQGKNSSGDSVITVRKIVWEIPQDK